MSFYTTVGCVKCERCRVYEVFDSRVHNRGLCTKNITTGGDTTDDHPERRGCVRRHAPGNPEVNRSLVAKRLITERKRQKHARSKSRVFLPYKRSDVCR